MMMRRRTLLVYCVQLLVLASSSSLPEVASYAKVSRNGASSTSVDRKKITTEPVNEARSFQGPTISRSPVYVPSEVSKLRNGEALDHPTTKRYSTLDREAIAKFDAVNSRKQANDRFIAQASFDQAVGQQQQQQHQHSNAAGQQTGTSEMEFSIPKYATLPQSAYSTSYDYQTNSKPMENNRPPLSEDEFPTDPGDSYSKIPDSYRQPDVYTSGQADAPKFPVFQSSSTHADEYPPKPVDFPDHFDRPTFIDDSYGPHEAEHDHHHDLIYDHPPDHDFHHHHHHRPTTTSTEEPETNDQRLSKRPYSYYYIGKKLWYLPLYFSIYFILYIAALILKSIARHKIKFPESLAAAAGNGRQSNDGPSWLDLAERVFDGIDTYKSLEEKLNHS